MYDAIVVGARCAGAATAMLLARRGHRVLVVDRSPVLKDALSTHFLWPRGTSYLNKWGLFESLKVQTPTFLDMHVHLEDVRLQGQVQREHLAARFSELHGGEAEYVTQEYCSARRTVLDPLLLRAAEEAGAEVRLDFRVEGLISEAGRVVGIEGTGPGGRKAREQSKVVVGADGRASLVAKAVKAPEHEVHHRCSFAYYSYYSGVDLEPRIMRRGRLGAAIVPTNGNVSMVLVFGPADWFDAFRANPEENARRLLLQVSPEAAERVAAGKREENFRGTDDMSAFWRQSAGKGWLLAGDAAAFKDQSSAIGITHAFRDAELAAEAISKGLVDPAGMDAALDDYAMRRYHDGIDYYRFACTQAEMTAPRLDELELYDAVAARQELTNRFLGVFGDTYPVRRFMSRSSIHELFRHRAPFEEARRAASEARLDAQCQNPFLSTSEHGSRRQIALSRSALDYARGLGDDLLARTESYGQFVSHQREQGHWPHTRFIGGSPVPGVRQLDELGRAAQGVNFASQDYLSLTTHPGVRAAAEAALRDYGPHSAGSAMGLGNTELSRRLEKAIAEHLRMDHVLLFPTGWAAGFGSIAGLVGSEDYVLMDALAHNCLQLGARSSGAKIDRHLHVDVDSARYLLKRIRGKDRRNGILVVTESLFSMHADWPRLSALQEVCREYRATLLVDTAHDAGALGPSGTGQLGIQDMLGKVDLVMGSFSKTFASNGGFLATHQESVKQYVKHFAGSHTYSNGLSAVQAAVVGKAFEIVRSPEGDERRRLLMRNIQLLRDELSVRGHTADGQPSPIVPVVVSDERAARIAYRGLWQEGVGVTMVEFPIVESGKARFRLQCMSAHTPEDCRTAAKAVSTAIDGAFDELAILMGHRASSQRPARVTLGVEEP